VKLIRAPRGKRTKKVCRGRQRQRRALNRGLGPIRRNRPFVLCGQCYRSATDVAGALFADFETRAAAGGGEELGMQTTWFRENARHVDKATMPRRRGCRVIAQGGDWIDPPDSRPRCRERLPLKRAAG
jgi:hypothetical protein